MHNKHTPHALLIVLSLACFSSTTTASPLQIIDTHGDTITLEAGHPSLKKWQLPDAPPSPADNAPTPERIELGKALFFEPRLSGDGTFSCGTCHNPLMGWSDGLPTGKGFGSKILPRATPTIVNIGYNKIQQWDGKKRTLEDQAMGPMKSPAVMSMDIKALFTFLAQNTEYQAMFEKAYPGEGINDNTVAKAVAAFERSVVSHDSAFDKWVEGDAHAMTEQQIRGFALFIDPKKGNCSVCHSGANFNDNGFHNVGLASFGKEDPDLGRYKLLPLPIMKGAFKTPTIREAAYTAPYFHDGSAKTLRDVVDFYTKGGIVKTNLSSSMKSLTLTDQEKDDLVAFIESLTEPRKRFVLPILPR